MTDIEKHIKHIKYVFYIGDYGGLRTENKQNRPSAQYHQVIREAQRGYTVLVENQGQPEVAIVDIIDYQLQRAAMHYFGFPKEFEQDVEISEVALKSLPTDQDRFNLVMVHYLGMHLSIGRSAELLGMSPPDLHLRLMRSGIPLRIGPESQAELEDEIKVIKRSLRGK